MERMRELRHTLVLGMRRHKRDDLIVTEKGEKEGLNGAWSQDVSMSEVCDGYLASVDFTLPLVVSESR